MSSRPDSRITSAQKRLAAIPGVSGLWGELVKRLADRQGHTPSYELRMWLSELDATGIPAGLLEVVFELGAVIAANPKGFAAFNRRVVNPAEMGVSAWRNDLLVGSGVGRFRFHCRCSRIVDNNWGDSFGGPDEGLHWLWLAALVELIDEAIAEPKTDSVREDECQPTPF